MTFIGQERLSASDFFSATYISTLRNILAAMGADLKIIASFPEGDVQINQFNEIRGEARCASVAEKRETYSARRTRH